MPTEIKFFQKELEKLLGNKLQLRINDNRSTMLSVKWDPQCPKVSLHRIFLEAPKNIMEELACYIGNNEAKLAPSMKAYIDDNLQKIDYSHQLDLKALETCGSVYDIQQMYNQLNCEYFGKKLNLAITWFGYRALRQRSSVTFGLYTDSLRLIKIHRMLDHHKIPDYFVSYVIFHEMLHYIYPPFVDETGIRRVHSRDFKNHEKEFHDYERAQMWLEKQRNNIFRGALNGRS